MRLVAMVCLILYEACEISLGLFFLALVAFMEAIALSLMVLTES